MMDEGRDWTAIEQDYRAGVLSLKAICIKHSVSLGKLKTTAEKYMWERCPVDPLALQVAHGVATLSPDQPKFGMDSNLNKEEITQAAVLTAASVIRTHRKDVRVLRESAEDITAFLTKFLLILKGGVKFENGVPKVGEVDLAEINKFNMIAGKDTPADLLEKLSRVLTRLVAIERQAFGLDVMPLNPNDGESQEAIRTEMNKLWNQIQEAQKSKSLH